MNRDKIKAVKLEQHRLSTAMAKLEQARTADDMRVTLAKQRGDVHVYHQAFPKLTGAVRRASLDLTRVLADLRRPS